MNAGQDWQLAIKSEPITGGGGGGNALFVSPAKIIIFLVLGPEKWCRGVYDSITLWPMFPMRSATQSIICKVNL